jgi:hypothetical protein
MSEKIFNPFDPKYKKVEDLPEEEQAGFSNVEGGFVRKEAKEEFNDAEKIVELANRFKDVGMDAKEVLNIKPRSKVIKEVGQVLKGGGTAMDILRERAVEAEIKPIDILREEAKKEHAKKYPEKACLEKLRSNPEVLTGFPRYIWENRKFMLEAVKLNGKTLRKSHFCGDLEIVMEAVKHDGLALQYASYDLKDNKDIVLEAVKQNPEAIKFASKDIRKKLKKALEI